MNNWLFFLPGFLLAGLGSYVSLPVKRVLSPPLKTGLMARRMENYAALPAEDWRPDYDLDYIEYYAAVLQIGSPVPQRQSVIIDTGSAITFVACTGCPASKCNKHDDPNFVPTRSESFRWEDCPSCKSGSKFSCQSNHQCKFNLRYYDGAGASGRVFSDLVDFGWDPLRLQMGCASDERGGVITDHADGMMGLAVDPKVSLAFQIGDQLHHTQVAHCFKSNGEGTLIFGEWEKPKNMTWAVLNVGGNHYYKTRTLSIWVGDRKVTSDNRLEKNHFKGTVWDTGSPHMWMPKWAYALTRNAFLDVMKKYKSVSKGNQKICFMVDRDEALKTFPLFRFEQPDNIWLELTPMQYLVSKVISKGQIAQCVDLIDAGNNSEGVAFGSTNMLNMLISYDYTHKKFGFMEHNCDCFLLPKANCVDGDRTEGGHNTPALWVPTRLPTVASSSVKETHIDESVTTPVDSFEHVNTSLNILAETTVYPTLHPSSNIFSTVHPREETPLVPSTHDSQTKSKSSTFSGNRLLKIVLAFTFGLCVGGAIIMLVSKLRLKPNYRPLQTSDLIPQLTSELGINEVDSFNIEYDEDDTTGQLL